MGSTIGESRKICQVQSCRLRLLRPWMPISSLQIGLRASAKPHAQDACECLSCCGTIPPLCVGSPRQGVRTWHSCVRFVRRSLYPGTMSATPTIKPGVCLIRTSRRFARWSGRVTNGSACALAVCGQDWSKKRFNTPPPFQGHYGAPQSIRPPRSINLMTEGSSGESVKVRPPSLLLSTSPTSPFASRPRPARAFPLASSSRNSSAFTPFGFCASADLGENS